MQAIISGHLGLFATSSGTSHLLFNLDSEEGSAVQTNQLGYAFQGGQDAYKVEVRSINEARALTQTARDADLALRLFILLLDSRDSDAERRELAEDLNSLMASAAVRKHVAKSFYSHAFLPTFDIPRAKRATAGLVELDDFLEDLVDHQPAIDTVRRAFDDMPPSVFSEKAAVAVARNFAMGQGCFFALSRGVKSGDAGMAVLSAFQTLKALPNSREVVGTWTEAFKKPNLKPRKGKQKAEDREEPLEGGPYVGRAARRAFEGAMGQQPTIIEKLKSGEVAMARRYAEDLVASQKVNSSPQDIAKSLCRLSKEAQRVGIVVLQYEWAFRASEICPEDPMTHGHLMDSLINLHRFNEAYDVLERVRDSAPSFHATGYARILRSQGRLPEAETAYRTAIAKYAGYDDEFHAHAGLGGTLRELGRLDESLVVYEEAIKNIAEEPILFAGYAASLVEVGRLADARQSYSRASGHSNFERLVALNGLASISKLTGDFVQAERDYSRIISDYPHDSFALVGLADLRRLQGRHLDAVRIYRQATQRFPHTPLPHLGLAETLKDMNKHSEALVVLREAIPRFPEDIRLAVSFASVLRVSGQAQAALQAINHVIRVAPKSISAALERGHVLKALGGHDDQALRAYDQVLEVAPHSVHALIAKASLLAISGQHEDAVGTISTIHQDTQLGWRAENLRALIELRSGDLIAAKKRAEAALSSVKFDRERRLIKSTLASILIKQRAHSAALDVLAPAERIDDDITRIVRLHASAFLARTSATKAYRDSKDVVGVFRVVREQIGVQLGLVQNARPQARGWLEDRVQLAVLREAA